MFRKHFSVKLVYLNIQRIFLGLLYLYKQYILCAIFKEQIELPMRSLKIEQIES
jgi:hypothetical protein